MIKSVNGQQTATSDDLRTVLAGLKPGKTVKVSILRQDGTTTTKNVTLGELPVN